MDDCPLCRKLADPPGDDIVWRFSHSLAVLGPWQYYQGYCILIAKRHVKELFDLTAAERQAYTEEMATLAAAVAACFRPRKLNYELLGNQVPHLHWHLFPRYEADPEHLKAVWLALDRAERDPAERQRLQAGPLGRAAVRDALRQELGKSSVPS